MADRLAINTPGEHERAHILLARCKHPFQVGTHAGRRGHAIDCNSHGFNLLWGKSPPVIDEAVKICGCKGADSQFHNARSRVRCHSPLLSSKCHHHVAKRQHGSDYDCSKGDKLDEIVWPFSVGVSMREET